MDENKDLFIVAAAQCNAAKVADANIDGHLHAEHCSAQHDTLAMKFDVPYMSVGARIVRVEANW